MTVVQLYEVPMDINLVQQGTLGTGNAIHPNLTTFGHRVEVTTLCHMQYPPSVHLTIPSSLPRARYLFSTLNDMQRNGEAGYIEMQERGRDWRERERKKKQKERRKANEWVTLCIVRTCGIFRSTPNKFLSQSFSGEWKILEGIGKSIANTYISAFPAL